MPCDTANYEEKNVIRIIFFLIFNKGEANLCIICDTKIYVAVFSLKKLQLSHYSKISNYLKIPNNLVSDS